MNLGHFEALRPICPACRGARREVPLCLQVIEGREGDDIRTGVLDCAHCGAQYPIIDGLPIIVPDVRRYVRDNLFYLMARDDLPPLVEGLIGDAAGPGSGLDAVRQHLSSYAWDHWGDRDPQESRLPAAGGALPGSIVRLLEAGLALLPGDLPPGPVLDIGCGGGRSSVELARRTGRPVLGIDLSVSLARLARRAVVGGSVSYPRRRIGLVYDRRDFALPAETGAAAVDVWICDVLALPFSPGSFALACGLNVLDCLADPRAGLAEIERALADGGGAILAAPFDWAAQVTPVESWLGGHSQRGSHLGDAEPLLEALLGEMPAGTGRLRRYGTPSDLAWHVRLHERSCMHYRSYVTAAQCAAAATDSPGDIDRGLR